MTAYTGQNLYVTFGGTVAQADYRSFEPSGEIGLEDGSAGADVGRTYLSTLKDGNATLILRSISGTAGTAMWKTWVEGAAGTLIWYPQGTASNGIKGSVYATISSRNTPDTYDQVSEWTFEFQFNDSAGVVYSTV